MSELIGHKRTTEVGVDLRDDIYIRVTDCLDSGPRFGRVFPTDLPLLHDHWQDK